jgi:4a-hydroxytetrahydrobiopterin dehydratase
MASTLASKSCSPCKPGTAPLGAADVRSLLSELGGGWQLIGTRRLSKAYNLPDFADALALANRIGAIAEDQGHHPDLLVRWGQVRVELWTHTAGGLTESDFVLAAKLP